MLARGEADDARQTTRDRVDTYRRLADELSLPILDTSRTTPEEATEQVLGMLAARGHPRR
ncbi:hypothetical protein MPOCJGCO_0129 [Methylobacterium trifolii]|uniref:Thymidylate kinase n=1 Tax=Methylobacterium trifolii TaxID=1003092 RepID=A0ABQ4TRX4_9HYPH|nr:hypothetical protein MPOCJGCO_0129 [Methylobacterium trifolii]